MKLPDFIKKIRKDLGCTQTVFANKLKLKQSTISGWENGMRELSASSSKKLVKFCQANNIVIKLEEFL